MHPDKNKGKTTDRFKEITAAYNVLGDAKKKIEYDNMRKYSQSSSSNYQGGNPFGQGFGGFSNPFGGS